jgi:hypothetical protein
MTMTLIGSWYFNRRFQRLQIDREADVRHPAPREGHAAGERGHVLHVRRSHDALAVDRDVGEDAVEIDVLLREGADQIVKVMPGDRENRLPVELRVIQPVQQMQPARSGGGKTDAELAGVLRIRAGHERGRLLVPDLNEPDRVLALPERFHDAVDSVARQPEHDLDAPALQHVDEHIRSGFPHHQPRRDDPDAGWPPRELGAST